MKPQGLASFKNPRLFREDSRKLPETPDQGIKKLAELKAYLEKRVTEHENEIRTLKSFLETVDNLLAERSYRRVDVSQSLEGTISKGAREAIGQVISTMSGVQLAKLAVEGQDLIIAPASDVRFDVSSPPFRSFLVEKVLEPMRKSDEESARKHEVQPERVMSYTIDHEAGILKELRIRNYGDPRRLNEIKDKVRWTFRRMYEKTIGTSRAMP